MKISEAAAARGCHLETIRYYERSGLMPAPARTASGYREYSPTEVDRLRFISRGRELGFSLEEIRSLLSLDDALLRYRLTAEEFLAWQKAIDKWGMQGLRTTRIQQYR